MRTSRKAALVLALAGAALPVLAQDRPESILPPGFNDPQPAPSATPAPRATPSPAVVGSVADRAVPAGDTPLPTPTPTQSASPAAIDPATLAYYELPPVARHDPARLGPLVAGGLTPDAFGGADGQVVETLMRRLSAPIPSRWLSILLRRTLVSQVDTPRRTNGADFAAERAWLLLRMGEAVAARAVVQDVDTADYTPKLYQVAINAMLATGDPAGLCPLADTAVPAMADRGGERGWVMAQAICAGLGGEPQRAQALIVAARRRGTARGIDLLLAQKAVGAGAAGQSSVTIEWAGVDVLTAWRFGLATATGVAIPDELLATVGPQVRLWQAVAPAVSAAARVRAAEAAATQGVLSSAALVDLYASIRDDEEADAAAQAVATDLRAAYVDQGVDARMAAMKRLWGEGARVPYARLVLTARAAARLPARADEADADRLVASMLTAGLDRAAMRWLPVVPRGGDAWAMLVLADPAARGAIGYGELSGYSGSGDAARKQRLLFAGLAGLDRLAPADVERAAAALDVRIGATNSWTQALDRASAAGQAGTVVLLCAIAMQTPDWAGVSPAALYRMTRALRAVGLEGEARMIAAEAIARS